METIIQVIQTLGFPIAVALGLGFAFYKVLNRVMDENKVREEKYQEILVVYGEKMGEISTALSTIKDDIDELKP